MSISQVSAHAQARMQQRGITPDLLRLLADYGATTHDHQGAELRYFNKSSRQRLLSNEGRRVYRAVESKLDVYAVVALDGCVVTVGHRDRRIPRY